MTEDEINKINHYTLQPKLDKDGQPVVVNGIPQYERVLTKIEKCESTPTTLTQRDAQVTIDGKQMKYKRAFYRDGTMANAVSTDRGWNYNPGKAVYFEPDLTKYDKQFVDAYLKMKAEFDGNMLLRKTYLRGDYASEAAINDALMAISKHYLFPKNMFLGTELATNCEIVSTKYTNPKVKGQFADKKIHISETIVLDLKSAWQKIQLELQGIKQEFTYSEAKALNVYIHELIHSQTPTNKILDINERVLREGLTEILARRKTKKFTRTDIKLGSYDSLVTAMKKNTKKLSENKIKDCLNSEKVSDKFFELIGIKKREEKDKILQVYIKKYLTNNIDYDISSE